MQTQRIDITQLSSDPANARKHSQRNIEAIASSLRRFGQQKPIVVDKSNVVRAGNGTLEAARHLGWDQIDVVFTNLESAEATAFAIADNRTAELAEWNDDVLAASLQGLNEELQAAAGYEGKELEQILSTLDTADVVEDEVPEPPAEPKTKPGDLWILGDHRLLCGDSTNANNVAQLVQNSKNMVCFTSPPYNLGSSVALRNGARKTKTSAYNDNLDDNAIEWSSLMSSFIDVAINFCDLLVVNVQMLAGNKIPLLKLFGNYAEQTVDIAIWSKTNPPPAMADKVMTSAFEFFWMLSSELNPKRTISTSTFKRGTFSNVYESAIASGHDANTHGAVFSLSLASHFVENLIAKKHAIYEPFCGTGTTLIAAEQLGRKCYGMELSPQYCDVIVERWQNLTGKDARRDGT